VACRFDVYVVPRSSRPGPDGRFDGLPRVRVRSAPEDGKANAEVERVLRKVLGGPVRLVGGGRSRRKSLESDLPAAELAARLKAAFGP
jgi:uncharacterized protein YggU (UPF0235/DUF167 family)